jgi:hypothetical protein
MKLRRFITFPTPHVSPAVGKTIGLTEMSPALPRSLLHPFGGKLRSRQSPSRIGEPRHLQQRARGQRCLVREIGGAHLAEHRAVALKVDEWPAR